MKILYVNEEKIRINGIINALMKLGVAYEVYPKVQKISFPDEKEIEEIVRYLARHRITHIISVNLVDNLVLAAERANIAYLSIIWDAPYLPLFSEYGRRDNCWFAVFDKKDLERFESRKVPHILYQPLAVDSVAIEEWNKACEGEESKEYKHDICFLGNLYDDNFFDEFCQNMPQHLMDFFADLFEQNAFCWDGTNQIYGTVSDEMLANIREVTPGFQLVNFFEIEDTRYFEVAYLFRKLAYIERVCTLNMLAEKYPVTLYTGSKAADSVLNHVTVKPPVSAGHESWEIFRSSKINLNISLKCIEAGTPLRVMDIMGAGGFVMTNYCPETAELFQEDKEIVMFRTPEELKQKVEYYLTHDAEREQIARAGYEKVMSCYTFEKKMKSLLDWVTENDEIKYSDHSMMEEYDMEVQEIRNQLNELLRAGQYDEIKELFDSCDSIVKQKNDLAIARTMISVCEQEKEEGQRILFEKVSSLEEIVSRYTKLMFYLRRFEFDIMDDGMDEFNAFLQRNQVSLQELFVVMYCGTINKEKVLQIVRDKMISGEIAL